ncbi:hypothetical protein [Nostoc sp. FACHB-133]|uniref:hypothetical protein n=1 Tax=Nostoc sp. FACHB-133 TaxID=2692835 RepID=UPI001687F0D5|nr:hypothetical protein [Nostoc sp. FACHB-133]MBD2522341.1 hypothetical protein [Nostoc sp. FACHB-133]
MKADLQELQITHEELENLIGIKNIPIENSYIKKVLKSIEDMTIFFGTLALLGCISAKVFMHISPGHFFWILSVLMISIGVTINKNTEDYAKFNINKNYEMNYKSSNIADEVKKYNQLVKNIAVIEQLQEIGHDVSLDDRHKVIKGFQFTRDDLIRALKTERILRENPDFSPEEFAINLSTIKTLQICEQASEYGQLLNEALQVAVSVQEEMRRLQNQRKI